MTDRTQGQTREGRDKQLDEAVAQALKTLTNAAKSAALESQVEAARIILKYNAIMRGYQWDGS